ncbi:peptide ABC transporter substrate-binding protein [Ktedonosporobacter rubrisoli]|uniref:Peptide ABC transporter substrate-binding protein n=1 Tax=Ktedonosporobacter rubrisoli TaxID=2509675 RepID=A0A4P6JTN2_KTERU|nr:peptide ABC transporter substrate-binding protein [Ktedonosporobacter rubrisoli]QBD78685.1 peptide ABC transporter substrate-binding protein [Ktedonosporobacter rubrisoli]
MKSNKSAIHKLAPIFFCLLSVLLAACGGSNTTTATTGPGKAPENQQIAVIPLEGVADAQTLDPAIGTDSASVWPAELIFTGLVSLNDKLAVEPQLAQSYSVAADGVTWTFKLRPNLKFSDGAPLTSADIAYSLDRAFKPELKSSTSPIYLALLKDGDKRYAGKIPTLIGDSIKIPDPQTVILTTTQPAIYFLDTLTFACAYTVEKSLIDKYGDSKFTDHLNEGGGAGPWKVSKYIHSQYIEFTPNTNYFGPKPQLKKLVMPFYASSDTAYKDYQVGRISAAIVPPSQVDGARALPNKQYHQVPQNGIYYYAMNYLVKPFDNIKVRQAFALALNKDQIAHNVYKDTVIPTNHIVPQGMPGYNSNLTGPDGTTSTKGNPAKAKQLLEEGLKEEGMSVSSLPPVTVTVASRGRADFRDEIAVVQQMWQSSLGIKVIINDIEWNKLLSDTAATTNNPKGLSFWRFDWGADYPDPQNWLTLQFDKGSPNNYENYGQNSSPQAAQQAAMQQLMEKADGNANPSERMQQYNQVEQQLVNDVAWLPLYQLESSIVYKPCLVGLPDNFNDAAFSPNDWGRIYISTATPCTNTSTYQ